MIAQCICCGSTESVPVSCGISETDDREVLAYWFLLDEDGAPVHMGLDEKGEIDYNFKISTDLELEVEEDEAHLVYCPKCMGDLFEAADCDPDDEEEDDGSEEEYW